MTIAWIVKGSAAPERCDSIHSRIDRINKRGWAWLPASL